MKGRNGDSNHNLPIKSVVKPDSEKEMFVGFFKFQFYSSNHTCNLKDFVKIYQGL